MRGRVRWASDGIVCAVLYVATVVSAALVAGDLSENPLFVLQLSDSASYLAWARQMAAGEGFGPFPFFVNPLYLFFLSVLQRFSLGSVHAFRIAQVVFAAGITPLTFLLGKQLFGRGCGLISAVGIIGYGVLAHASLDLSSAWMEALLLLVVALSWTALKGRARLALAGVLTGVATLARPTMLLFAAAMFLFLLLGEDRERGAGQGSIPGARISRAALFAAGVAVCVLPVTARNAIVGKDMVLVSSHGGINFFIGNSPGARGTFYAPPGFHEDLMSINRVDATRIAEEESGKTGLKPSEVSKHWFGRGLRFLAGSPRAAVGLYARKALLTLHSYEVPLNSTYSLMRESSPTLRTLVFPFSLFLVLGTLGMTLCGRRWRELLPLILLVVTQLGSVTLFFVSSRYRLPVMPLLAVFGGYATFRLAGRGEALGKQALLALAAVAAIVLLSLPYSLIRDIDGDSRASAYESLGIHYYDQGLYTEARESLERSVSIRPAIKSPHWYLARIHEARGDLGAAAREWAAAAQLYGPDSEWGRRAMVKERALRGAVTGH